MLRFRASRFHHNSERPCLVLRKNLSVDWSVRETVRAKRRAQIKLILKRHNCPPDLEARAIDLVLKQAEALSDAWMGA